MAAKSIVSAKTIAQTRGEEASAHRRLEHTRRERPSRSTTEMHRVGGSLVRPSRLTFAEATACRSGHQPQALRARCKRQSRDAESARQDREGAQFRKLRTFPDCDRNARSRSVTASASWPVGDARSGSTSPGRRAATHPSVHDEMHRVGGFLVRPSRLTSAEATACRSAIDLGCSVLGAMPNVHRSPTPVKGGVDDDLRNLRIFRDTPRVIASRCVMLWRGGTSSSPSRGGFVPQTG